ncbi:MAG: hypothetical protein EOO03_04945 [Chitinophagaceae bacterium]|nr:MAG: hypothetical protein EOO03_04945 [Chitinophagaceae bacterium]
MKKLALCFLLTSSTILLNAQSNQQQHKSVDEFVVKVGALDSQNVAQITEALTLGFSDKQQKARAIFYWIANNIALDAKAIKINDQRKILPEEVIKNRKATGLGFAKLFQEMSSLANIRCLVVDGYVKNNIDDLNEPADEVNHAWNVVQLGPSPDLWYYVDAARAAGALDKKMSIFEKDFTSAYFFANRALFNLNHFPDNSAWQLGPGPKGIKEFYSLPLFYNAAFLYDIKKPTPATGFIKTKSKAKVNFSIPYGAPGASTVELVIGTGRQQQKPEAMNFNLTGGAIVFSYQFKTEDSYPVRVVIDGKPVLEYMVESSE